MDSMNRVQGSIYGREILSMDVEAVKEALADQNVVDVERVTTMRNGQVSPNGLHILTFSRKPLPEAIAVGYMRYQIRQHYPRPLRCGGCCMYGHSKGRCPTKRELCRTCAFPRHEGQCENPPLCVNCKSPGNDHDSFDRNCPATNREVAITRMRVDEDISWAVARQRFEARVNQCQKTYASKVQEAIEREANERTRELKEVRAQRVAAEELRDELKKELEALRIVTEEILQLRLEKRRCEQVIAEHASERLAPMDVQEETTASEQSAKRSTAKAAFGIFPKRAMGAIPKAPTQAIVHVRTISTSSSEEEVASKCPARSNERDAPTKVMHDYEVDYGTFAEIPKAMREEIYEDFRSSSQEEPFLYRRVNDSLIRTSPNPEEEARAKLFAEYIKTKVVLRNYKKK
jgi:hypothetical protein